MLRIPCPHCGLRDQVEFYCAGENHPTRPGNPDGLSDEEWASHQFYRVNSRGLHLERWEHRFGCGQWFLLERSTLTHEIVRSVTFEDLPGEIAT
jgi:sarcosine oxidase subunit delta